MHQLRYAVAIADAGTFTAAAESVRVSQSGVSLQVAKLERELGVALFDRSPRRVELTAAGRTLLPLMREALARVDAIGASAAAIRGVLLGSLRLGAVTGLQWERLVDALTAMHERHPGVDVRLGEGASADLIAAVRAGELDLAVAAWAGGDPEGLDHRIVVDDAICAIVAPGHPWASRSRIATAELLRADLIALPHGTGARAALEAAAARAGGAIAPRWEVSTPAQVAALAGRRLGVGVLSETTAEGYDVVALPLRDPEARSTLGVVSRRNPTPAAAAFLALLAGPGDASGPGGGGAA